MGAMTKRCKISVIMPCFNHGEFVREAVESVRRAGREDMELIVVDDGSTDARTQDEMERLAAEGVHVIRQQNKGLAGARNAAVMASRGEFIFPLDADDRMRTAWIDRAIETLESNPRVGVVYGDAECFGARTGPWPAGPFDAERLMQENFIHCSALFRRAVWEENHGYDPTMPAQGAEDWDLWLGTLGRGWEFVYLPEVFFEYRQADGSMLARLRGFYEEVEEFAAKKHGLLYRRAWMQLRNENQSVRVNSRRLRGLLASRLRGKLGK